MPSYFPPLPSAHSLAPLNLVCSSLVSADLHANEEKKKRRRRDVVVVVFSNVLFVRRERGGGRVEGRVERGSVFEWIFGTALGGGRGASG